MTGAVSIVYSTYRRDPAFGWFADGLARQLGDDEVELVVVDGSPGPGRREQFEAAVGGRYSFRYGPAKPTVFNGPHQRVPEALHAASSARNTGVVLATRPYVVFVDDCSVPMPGWWAEVKEAARHHYVVAGTYQKHWAMEVVEGELVSSRSLESGRDIRWELGHDHRVVPMPGSHLFGCSVGLPRRLLCEVNGYDELCDGMGGEDYQLGVRLELAGEPLFFSRRMLTVESEEHHRGAGQQLVRRDFELPESEYRARLAAWGVADRATDGKWDGSHMVLDLVYGLRATGSLGNHYQLGELGPHDLEGTAATLPATYWFDGRAFEEL